MKANQQKDITKKYMVLYSETYQKMYAVDATSTEDAKEKLYENIGTGKVNPPEECADSSMTVLSPFYFTFGSDKGFPHQNGYIVIFAESQSNAIKEFRKKYHDRHSNCLNCSFVYTEDKWKQTGMGDNDKYPCYEIIYATHGVEPIPENVTREFYIDTPFGKLKVYAKHEGTDCPEDYPGVFVDFIDKKGKSVLLACTEYDPNKNIIQTCVYGDGLDDSPTDVVFHRNLQPD